MPRQTYTLAARQQLNASPRIQQALRLLQMSALDFSTELRQAVAANPFLEEEEEPAEPPAAPLAADLPGGDAPRPASAEAGTADVGEWAAAPTTLQDHLRWQLYASPMGARERMAAEVVIESLDDDGYLREDPAEAAARVDAEPPLAAAELDAGLRRVQEFDPAGIAARDLSECLALQLAALERDSAERRLALALVRHHLPALARHDFAALRRALGCGEDALRAAHALIRRLDPHPGRRFAPERDTHVVPDVIVVASGLRLTVQVNPAVMPRVRLNGAYAELMRRVRQGRSPLGQQLQEARWMLRNVEQRLNTVRRVAEAIVGRQHRFFAYGDIALRPLLMREVARDLELHESTVSRAAAHKYMATPRGLFRFGHFFSRQLATATGGTCSAAAVQALIKEMIAAERRDAPLSDVTLARMLNAQGIRVARRTVAKYRGLLRLPPAEFRRQ